MAPSLLLDRNLSPTYSTQLKRPPKVDGGVSFEAHTPVGGNWIHHSSTNGNGHIGDSRGIPHNGNSSGHQRSGRQFITAESLLHQSKVTSSSRQQSSGASKKPNILYIMADQMAAPLQKFNDPDSVIKTPHLDELARTGINFSSAYCNSPLCAPSRFTMCTGQLPSKIGGYDNASILGPEVPTYAHYLRREGYETALAGKMHFIGPDQLHGFEHR